MINLDHLAAQVPLFMLVLARISAFVLVTPVFSILAVSARVRVMISFVLALFTMTTLPPDTAISLTSPLLYLLIFKETLLGLLSGFTFLLIFEIAFVSGEILSMQGGLSMATVLDPVRGGSIPAIGNFYYLSLAIMFFAMNIHLGIIDMVIRSFHMISPTQLNFNMAMLLEVVHFLQVIFYYAIWVSLPCILALLIVNVVFAIVAATSPQFSIFNIGFPIITMGALLLVYVTIGGFIDHSTDFFNEGFHLLSRLLRVVPYG